MTSSKPPTTKKFRPSRVKDIEELELESALFGVPLPLPESDPSALPDSDLFTVTSSSGPSGSPQPAWADPDDASLKVDLSQTSRLRKLRKMKDGAEISGTEYAARLREQHEAMRTAKTSWAEINEEGEDDEDEDIAVLRQTSALVDKKAVNAEKLTLTRVKDANVQEINSSVVQCVEWNPASKEMMLTAGYDKTLRLFRVDGEENAKMFSLHFADLPIQTAKFCGPSHRVILAGRRSYYYDYDLGTGSVKRLSGILGRPNEKSLESFEVSKDGLMLAFTLHDGFISLISRKTYREMGFLKVASNHVRKVLFCGQDDASSAGGSIIAASDDGDVYKWDLRNQSKPLWRRTDVSNLDCRALAHSDVTGLYAVGTPSGIVNVYRDDTGERVKTIMNLTTAVDCVSFSPDGNLLSFSSRLKKDAVRIFHVPSGRVLVNWPLTKTPVSHASIVRFSPNGKMLACGNDRGKVLLWKVNGGAL